MAKKVKKVQSKNANPLVGLVMVMVFVGYFYVKLSGSSEQVAPQPSSGNPTRRNATATTVPIEVIPTNTLRTSGLSLITATLPPVQGTSETANASEPNSVATAADLPNPTHSGAQLDTQLITPSLVAIIAPATFTAIPDVMVRVKASKLNIRAASNLGGNVLGQIPFDETVHAIGISSDGAWTLVNYQNIEGWISLTPDFVTITGDLNTLAIIAPKIDYSSASKVDSSTKVPSKRSATSVPRATSKPRPTNPPSNAACNCSGPDLDCDNFSRQRDAQACYNQCMQQTGRDIFRLDGNDNDGRACESLP